MKPILILMFICFSGVASAQNYSRGVKVELKEDAIYWEKMDGKSMPFKQDSTTIFKRIPNTIFWTCLRKDQIVYTTDYYIVETGRFKQIIDSLDIRQRAKEKLAWRKEMVLRYGKSDAALIFDNRVRIGMKKSAARESWGSPQKINRTILANTVDEQWVYENSYLYFTNGILTAIQD
jgi:hypothetical protein